MSGTILLLATFGCRLAMHVARCALHVAHVPFWAKVRNYVFCYREMPLTTTNHHHHINDIAHLRDHHRQVRKRCTVYAPQRKSNLSRSSHARSSGTLLTVSLVHPVRPVRPVRPAPSTPPRPSDASRRVGLGRAVTNPLPNACKMKMK